MRELLELVNLLRAGKLTVSAWATLLFEANSKQEQLFSALIDGKITTDEAAQVLIYGSVDLAANKYPSLRSKVKERLVEAVFLLDFSETNQADRTKVYLECQKKWAAALILLDRHAQAASIEIMEQLLRHAKQYEFTDLSVQILYRLRLFYIGASGEHRKFIQYNEAYQANHLLLAAENEAEDGYNETMSLFGAARPDRKKIATKAAEFARYLAPHLQSSNNFRLHLYGRLLEITALTQRGAYQEARSACEAAIQFFEGKDFECKTPLQTFYYQHIVCCIQLRDFAAGHTAISKQAQLVEAGSFNWFKFQELLFLLAMHTREYEAAFTVQSAVTKHPKLAKMPEFVQETWTLYAAYVQYLAHVGKIAQSGNTSFRLQKFLNEVPGFSADKRGMNIPVLVIHTLFLMADKETAKAVDRLEALDKYCARYLKDDVNIRSHCFLKMLLQIPVAGFHPVAAARKAEKFKARLMKVPLEIANQPFELEIVPYEDLWALAMEALAEAKPRSAR